MASPLGAVGRGLAAGALGTAAMTAVQSAYYKSTDSEPSSMPGEMAGRIIGGVFHRQVREDRAALRNQLMHWSYGTGWGVVYGLVQGTYDAPIIRSGLAFGAGAWAASLLLLPAAELAPPVWKYPPAQLASDVAFHLVYGLAAAGSYRALPS